MSNWLANILSFLFGYFKKSEKKSKSEKWNDVWKIKRLRTAYNHEYNKRDYVKIKKHNHYLVNKERYAQNKRNKRLSLKEKWRESQ